MAGVQKYTGFMLSLRKWAYSMSGFNKYGLYRDDILYETDEVKEAINRLPEKIVDERNYRLLRAIQLSIQKNILPEKEWTKYEDDMANRYLMPLVEEVKRENREKDEWNSNY